jgi:hypothetical protein
VRPECGSGLGGLGEGDIHPMARGRTSLRVHHDPPVAAVCHQTQSSSASRLTAGGSGFLTLIQQSCRPAAMPPRRQLRLRLRTEDERWRSCDTPMTLLGTMPRADSAWPWGSFSVRQTRGG